MPNRTRSIKNWSKFQHYQTGDRAKSPEWIKVYRHLLDDIEWHELDGEAAKMLVNLWMLAAENGGTLPPIKVIAFRLRCTEKQINSILSRLPHWIEVEDSDLLADGYQGATLEEEGEEKENRGAIAQAKRRTQIPEDWSPPPLEGFSSFEVQKEVPQFRDYHAAKGSVMKDWDAAFRTWMRNSRKFAGKSGGSTVIQGSFRPPIAKADEGPKITEEERQANLAKLAALKFGGKKL